MRDLESDAFHCHSLCSKLAAIMVNIDNRRYAEVQFPVPITDCYDALRGVYFSADCTTLVLAPFDSSHHINVCLIYLQTCELDPWRGTHLIYSEVLLDAQVPVNLEWISGPGSLLVDNVLGIERRSNTAAGYSTGYDMTVGAWRSIELSTSLTPSLNEWKASAHPNFERGC